MANPEASQRIGDAHFVQLGNRKTIGFILALRHVTEKDLGFPVASLRPLGQKVEGLSLPESVVKLIQETARQTLSPLASCLSLAIPPSIKDRLVTSWSPVDGVAETNLGTAQKEALRLLREVEIQVDSKSKPLADGAKKTLQSLEKKGLVQRQVTLSYIAERHRLTGVYRLTPDETKVEIFLQGPGKKRPAQAITIMRLQGSESVSFSVQEIKSLGAVADQTILALIKAEILVDATDQQIETRTPHSPNQWQQTAIEAIVRSVSESVPEKFLLHGVTGSGKTEVYLHCAAAALSRGKQVLYLVPEIALTAQVIAQLRERFGNLVAVVHSNMTPSERLENWLKIKSGHCPVVLGPRSAIFAPMTNLGLIVVDEEHETSYKQENNPKYETKNLVSFLSDHFNCPALLGSATPSIETYFRAEKGEITLLSLPNRTASAKLPEVQIVNLAELYREKRASVISPQLDIAIREALSKSQQVILFLNRRAYSPFLICRDCGHRFTCTHCSVSLALHRRDMKLRCHMCGHQESVPETCPQCSGTRVSPFGTGTEKVEEVIKSLYPDYQVARLDRDISRKKGALEETLAAFRCGSTHILVGTQMVAKGFDFPNVTVVGVVAADISLNVPDFRSGERTFQLLSQVAGRAGRGTEPGKVVVQTLSPDNVAVVCAQTHDYMKFYNAELQEREGAGYPPYQRLINVLITGENRQEVVKASTDIASKLRLAAQPAQVLGPVDCPVERIQNLWRRHVLVKIAPKSSVEFILEATKPIANSKTRISIDVDPISLI